jgi:hypothetical protein
MTSKRIFALIASLGLLAACEGGGGLGQVGPDKTLDRGVDAKHLSQLVAGVWIDPEGCDHWIIDDGVEGYLSARLDDAGKPICSGAGAPNHVVGPFKSGTTIRDPL